MTNHLTPSPESVVAESEHWMLAVNRNQNLLGKSMLVLRRPCEAVVALSQPEWLALHHQLGRVTRALAHLFSPDQINYAFLMNVDAQVHMHVIPRYASTRTWAGELFDDPHWGGSFGHEQRLLRPHVIERLAEDIRKALVEITPRHNDR